MNEHGEKWRHGRKLARALVWLRRKRMHWVPAITRKVAFSSMGGPSQCRIQGRLSLRGNWEDTLHTNDEFRMSVPFMYGHSAFYFSLLAGNFRAQLKAVT